MVTNACPRNMDLCKGGVVRGCRNIRKSDRLLCSRCYMRQWREANPLQAAFATLRDHARARGIEFSISFEDFREFAELSDYVERKGTTAQALTVDRRDNLRGYVPGNIQPLTRAENSVKNAKHDAHRMRQGNRWRNLAAA